MWDYRGLAALAAIIEEGNFERAAAVLAISQPAVSRRLRALGEWAGELLVIRSQPPQTTSRGQRLIAHFRQVQLLESGVATASQAHTPLPRLAIAVNADTAATWLLDALAPLLDEPVCLIDVHIDDQDETLRHLREGRVVGCIQVRQELEQGTLVELMPASALNVPLYWHQWNIQTPVTRALRAAIVGAAHRFNAAR